MAQEATTETVAVAEQHDDSHGAFPPFDPATFPSQILWLAISFGLLYYIMSKTAIPRIGTILEERNDMIADDLAEAGQLKLEADEAIAAYEQALAEARKNAHGIAQDARDQAKSEITEQQTKVELGLSEKLTAAEERINEVKTSALSEVDQIARDTAEALVDVLMPGAVKPDEISDAVGKVMAEAK